MANFSMGDSNNSLPVIYSFQPSLGVNREEKCGPCPLCHRMEKAFYCVECVRNGDFTRSKAKPKSLERFADKKLKMYKIKEEKSKLLQRYEESLSAKIKIENTKKEIFLCSERIRLLKDYLQCSEEVLSNDQAQLESILHQNDIGRQGSMIYVDKIKEMNKRVKDSACLRKSMDIELNDTCQSLQNVIRENVHELVTCIFPIGEVRPSESDSGSSMDNFSLLEEAQHMIYEKGQWVDTGSLNSVLQYSINEPCIPANGDYSAYSLWIKQHEDNLPSAKGNICQRDLAVGISAALCFTAHLVLVLTHYLDVHVPNNLCYSEFCGHELEEKQFLHKVAKLNANVVHLCLSQNVDSRLIHPHHTIPNLLLLLNPETSNLGRIAPINVSSDLMQMMEDSLSKDFLPMEENKYRDGDDNDLIFDWVNVPNIGDDETISPGECYAAAEGQSQASANNQPVTSIAGELMSSVALMWRAATGHK